MKLFGLLLIVICGAFAGSSAAAAYSCPLEALKKAKTMTEQLIIMLEYESPTVPQMLSKLRKEGFGVPRFIFSLSDRAERAQIISAIEENPDGFEKCDTERLRELFTQLGSADKECELQRLTSASAYFAARTDKLAPETERKQKLARTLGLLGGIFLAVMLI